MAEKTKEFLIGGLAGILGVIVGAVSTGVVNYVTLEKQQRERAVIDSFRFDQGDYPKEFMDMKIFVDKMRDLSTASADQVARLAEIRRKYPTCETSLETECLGAIVDGIQASRKELGVGQANSDDIEIIIKDYFLQAQKAAKKLGE